MASTKEIKRRINSISNTSQITNALEMVSASKMIKAQQRAGEAFGYSEGLFELVKMLSSFSDYKSIYLKKPEKIRRIAFVIVGPTRGFVGGLKSSLIAEIDAQIDVLKANHPDAEIVAVTINRLGEKIANSLGLKSEYYFDSIEEPPSAKDLESVKQLLLEGFEKENFDEIYLGYMHFRSILIQDPVVKKLLPIEESVGESADELAKESSKKPAEELQESSLVEFTFEPSAGEILDRLLPEYFENQLYMAMLDSFASEHSARMVSMQNATENAKELRNNLFLKFNKSRQTKITEELIDIVSGSLAS